MNRAPISVTPNGSPSAAKAGRNRHGREVQKIHEIRVIAEICIGAERVRLELADFVEGAGGRGHDHVDGAPRRFAPAFERHQVVLGLEGLGGGD